MATTATTLSLREARLVATASSGLTTTGTLAEMLHRLAVVQLDSINALARAHQLTLAARLPDTSIETVDHALWHIPTVFESWGHAASLLPISDWPLWAFRRRAIRNNPKLSPAEPRTTASIIERVRNDGPLTMRQLRGDEQAGSGWDWSPTKNSVEYLVWTGELVCVRRDRWNRIFDLPDRAIPHDLLHDDTDDQTCLAALTTRAARALGVATLDDLADYIRVKPATIRPVLPHTVLIPTTVDGWTTRAWAHPDALDHLDEHPAMFLGPFDNLIWYRKRVARLFDFEHTLEAYKPAAKRVHGYYVCPLLAGGNLVARADLARQDNALIIRKFSLNSPQRETIHHFAEACHRLHRSLGATTIVLDAAASASPDARAVAHALNS